MHETPDAVDEGPENTGAKTADLSLSAIASIVDLSFASAGSWGGASDKFHSICTAKGIDTLSDPLVPTRKALGYFLVYRSQNERAIVALDWRGNVSAPATRPDSTVHNGWSALVGHLDHPASKARFLDLIASGTKGAVRPDATAAAIRAYLEVSVTSETIIPLPQGEVGVRWEPQDSLLALGRALSLLPAISHKHPDLVCEAVEIAVARSSDLLLPASSDLIPAASLLRILAGARRFISPKQLELLGELVQGALRLPTDVVDVTDSLAKMSVEIDSSTRSEANSYRVRGRLLAAEGKPPIVAMHFLEGAARIAEDYQLHDLHAESIRRMQRLSRTEHEYRTLSTSVDIPNELLDAEVARLSAGGTWQEALQSWLISPSPTADAQDNRRAAEKIGQEAPIHRLVSHVLIGADNMPRWHAETEEDKFAADLAKIEQASLLLNSQLLAAALDRIKDRFGIPPLDQLTLLLSSNGAGDHALSAALARSFRRYWSGDFEGSLHTSVVRIEAAARALVLLLDSPAYVVARTNNQAKYVGLNDLLTLLEGHGFDEDWDRFLRTFLTEPTGMNLRHDLAHGFELDEPSKTTAAAALRAFSLFVVLLWKPGSFHRTTPPLLAPAWTVTDAVFDFVARALRSRRAVRYLVRAEFTAMHRRFRRGWPKR